jgi:hypothetical protein
VGLLNVVAVCVGSFRTVCAATLWLIDGLSVGTTFKDSFLGSQKTRCNCITQTSQVMPVNDTDTKDTQQSAYCATCRQHCSWRTYSKCIGSPFDQRLAGLFACTVQPYSVLRHTEILWQFDKLRVQQNCIAKYRVCTYLFAILNKLFFNA